MSLFSEIAIGRFLPTGSSVHALEARAKLVAAAIWIAAIVAARGAFPKIALLAVFLLVARLARIPQRVLWIGLRPLLAIFLITFAFQAVFVPGDALFRLGPFAVTAQGVALGLELLLTLTLFALVVSLLTLTTDPVAFADGLETLLSPLRGVGFPAHEFALTLTLALRFVPTLATEVDRIHTAQIARGARFAGANPLDRARSFLPVLVPLFVLSFRRADDLALAMEARGYRGGESRTRFRGRALELRDALSLAIPIATSLPCFWR